MGKGKKKFIDKANSESFVLLHRSQTDEAWAGDERPTEFILAPSAPNLNDEKRNFWSGSDTKSLGGASVYSRISRGGITKADAPASHITSLGFNNDGYDYTQHLKEMGSGTYISSSGSAGRYELPQEPGARTGELELPPEVLASVGELERDLKAITIDESVMDDDLRAALFDDADEGGDIFEVLDDDFVSQVLEPPTKPDFDFEAHMAALIAQSERQTVGPALQAPRGWEQGEAPLGRFLDRDSSRPGDTIAEGEEGEEDDDSGFFSDPDEGFGSEGEDNDSEQEPPILVETDEERRLLEEDFERTLAEYRDEDLGYMDEADEEALDGRVDLCTDETALQGLLGELTEERRLEALDADDAALERGLGQPASLLKVRTENVKTWGK